MQEEASIMLSRICLLTCFCALFAFSLIGAADEINPSDDLLVAKVRLRLNAIEAATAMEHYESLVKRETAARDSVRAAIKSGDKSLPHYQQALQEVQDNLEVT